MVMFTVGDFYLCFAGDGVPLSPMTSLEIPPNFDPNSSDIDEILLEADGRTLMELPPLDLTWDLLCDSNTFKVSMATVFVCRQISEDVR